MNLFALPFVGETYRRGKDQNELVVVTSVGTWEGSAQGWMRQSHWRVYFRFMDKNGGEKWKTNNLSGRSYNCDSMKAFKFLEQYQLVNGIDHLEEIPEFRGADESV